MRHKHSSIKHPCSCGRTYTTKPSLIRHQRQSAECQPKIENKKGKEIKAEIWDSEDEEEEEAEVLDSEDEWSEGEEM